MYGYNEEQAIQFTKFENMQIKYACSNLKVVT